MRLGDGLVGELPADVFTPRASAWSSAIARAVPRFAIASTYGSVTFVSAFVDVTGTAPGMFATQ